MTDAIDFDDDAAFLQALENLTLPREHFNHRGHLRLAFLYVRQYGFIDAMNRIRATIRAYATSQGAADKYHETITALYLSLISERMSDQDKDWRGFVARCPELCDRAIIDAHLPPETIADPRARTEIVFPARSPSAA